MDQTTNGTVQSRESLRRVGSRSGRSLWLRARVVGTVGISAMLMTAVVAPTAAALPIAGNPTQRTAGPWVLDGWRSLPAGGANQGVATVATPGHAERAVLRGDASVPGQLRDQGWWHIGDPGSARGFLLDAYQAHSDKGAKLFVLTAANGRRTQWVHRLVPGEMINNSFAAITPSGHWFVSGEWGKMNRLLVFPLPVGNRQVRAGHDLPLATTIRLTRPVRNVQGCSFASPTRLVCSTNDLTDDLFRTPQQLLSISLAHPVDGRPQTGRPRQIGQVPQLAGCGMAETEGIDVHHGRLLLVVRQSWTCGGRVTVFSYHLKAANRLVPARFTTSRHTSGHWSAAGKTTVNRAPGWLSAMTTAP